MADQAFRFSIFKALKLVLKKAIAVKQLRKKFQAMCLLPCHGRLVFKLFSYFYNV